MSRAGTITRRALLIGSVAVAGGVAFGAYIVRRPVPNPLLDGLQPGEAAITPFVKITPQGITLIVPRADIGQGIASMQAHLIAEELDIDPHTARLDPGQPDTAYFNGTIAGDGMPFALTDQGFVAETVRQVMGQISKITASQFTGGSSSTADLHETLRLAGATARETLKEAAARRTGVARSALRTGDGAVLLPDGRRIAYTALAAEAALLEPVRDVVLRPPTEWRRLGKPFQRTDIIAKSTGQQNYGIDVRLEGMLHATVRRNPGIGGAVVRFEATAARAMRGVRAVVPVEGGVGVLADNTWRAFRAAQAVDIEWAKPDYPATSDEMWKVLEDSQVPDRRNSRLRDDGDVDAVLQAADPARVVTAEYRTPFLAHAALEPLSATVLVGRDRVDIWTATQIPHVVRERAAKMTGIDPARVTLHALPGGGSFGRRLDADYVWPAIELAMTVPGTPVKMTLSREEDMSHDFPRPLHLSRCRGTVREGRVETMLMDTISPSLVASWFGRVFIVPPGPDVMLVWGAFDQPYAIPNYQVSGYAAPPLVPIGSWRSPGACSNSFFHESFLDELIHAAGADALQERLRLIDHDDSRRVLQAVAEMSQWQGSNIGEKRGRGVAFSYTHGVPVAEVVDVTLTDGGIRIDDVWVAADCGTVFDPVNAEAQITGSVVWALGHAMNCELTYADHAPTQTNYHQFQGMRLPQTPRIHVRLLGQATKVRGLGEPGSAPAAAALANAIFAATGKRLRRMPFNSEIDFV
jgi:isoquinoline 1-oxidoreductase subunit beta